MMKSLLEYCEISGTPVRKYLGNKKYIATGDVVDNEIISFENVSYENKPSRANQNVEHGEVLFAKMQNTKKVLIIDENNVDNIYSTGFYVIKPKQNIESKYLYWLFNSEKFNNDKDKNCNGATQKAINNEGLKKIEIKEIPEKSKQLMIIDRLDKVHNIINIRKKQIESLDELIKARFVELFGDPVSNPLGWEKKTLKEVCLKLNDGTHFSPESFETGEYKYVTAKNIKMSGFDFTNITYVPEEVHRPIYERCNPELGDVLYIKDGVTTGIAMVNTLEEEFTLLSSVALLKQDRRMMNGHFLTALLNNENMYTDIRSNMGGAAITRLTITKLNAIKVILPPIELQEQFASFVEQTDKSKLELQKSLEEIQNLFDSLMAEYFG